MKLSVFRNNDLVKELDLSESIGHDVGDARQQIFIGRGADCHVTLDGQQISRQHAGIIWENKKWSLQKISKRGNVLVNGVSVGRVDLHNGDIITINPFVVNVNIKSIIPEASQLVEGTLTETVATKNSEEINIAEENQDDLSIDTNEESIGSEDQENQDQDFLLEDDQGSKEDNEEEKDDNYKDEENALSLLDDVPTLAPVEVESEPIEDEGFEISDDNFRDELSDTENSNSDDEFASSDFDDEDKTSVYQGFVKFKLTLLGEFTPYDSYLVELSDVFIGRDKKKCQIFLDDTEVSSVHAVIHRNKTFCLLEDLRSSNGTILNGSRINKSELKPGDEFVIGGTTFTFNIVSDLLDKEQESLMPVEKNQEMQVEEVVEVGVDFTDGEQFSEIGEQVEDDANVTATNVSLVKKFSDMPLPRKLLVILIIGGALLMLLEEDAEVKKGSEKNTKDKKTAYLLNKKSDKKTSGKDRVKTNSQGDISKSDKILKNLSTDQLEALEAIYLASKDHFARGDYRETMFELDKIFAVIPEYKEAVQMYDLSKQGLADLEDIEKKRKREEQRKIRDKKIVDLVVKAKEAVKERQVKVAQAIFNQILEMDPENYDVPSLKMEIQAWEDEKNRKALDEEQKRSERKRRVDALSPGKSLYLQKKWFRAILKLEDFLNIENMDEDLIKEATDMLLSSRKELKNQLSPRLAKARSLREGQDLKGAYELYSEVLKIDPSNLESLNQINEIKDVLERRSRKVYREALISESLSLFDEAKEGFQEVQQISPTDSVYYRKATKKLDSYWD